MTDTVDPDRPCEHLEFTAAVELVWLTDPTRNNARVLRAAVRAWCKTCEEPVRWELESMGLARKVCTVEGPERLELRAPAYIADTTAELTRPRLWTPGS